MSQSFAREGPPPKLRAIRHQKSGFDARFFERAPEFWPIARAAAVFAAHSDWPEPSEYGRAFRISEPPVRFAPAPVKRKRPPGPIVREDLYDAQIVVRRTVPTRPRMWHDYLNALVWATFPRAKLALHRRQHSAIEAWIPQGASQLPNARTRELDALALVDEGGILVVGDRPIVFGHALFEGLVFEQPSMIARAVRLPPSLSEDDLAMADRGLAEMLEDPGLFQDPRELPSAPLRGTPSAGWASNPNARSAM